MMRYKVGILAALLAVCGYGVASSPAETESLPGQRIYREGLLPSGQPLRATVQQGVQLSGADAACARCHRRSGLGGSEGRNSIRPIAGRLLFPEAKSDQLTSSFAKGRNLRAVADVPERPVYTEASLAKTLREGIDPAGHRLDPLMPRYILSDAEAGQLHAYLAVLSSERAPGVSDTEIHFATIVAPGVSPERTQAMLDVLQAFVSDKNAGTRQEVHRRNVGRGQMARAYRTWVFHSWELSGPPETWRDQLAAYYRQQAVFAVIGGIGNGSWEPVHTFCESFGVPCVFPDVDYPVITAAGYYTLYFSRGVTLEAEVLAKHLLETGAHGKTGTIVQVHRDTSLGHLPASVLRKALQDRGKQVVVDCPLTETGRMPGECLSKLLGSQSPGVLVMWLDFADVQGLGFAGTPPPGLQEVYLSASLSGMRRPDLADSWLGIVHMVYPFDLPNTRAWRLERMKVWLRARKIPLVDERAQANAFFAVTIAGDAVAHLGENFSRDYFIERIEQMAQTQLSPSIYPHLSLGPGQRFASKGGYVVRFPPGTESQPLPVSDWMVP
ncbi:cytochrome C [Rhodoferax ferrireducens]|uniref:cytochrome C n=1 Tax=Rhodoferax ferrireducens TaxID=192843 RepID=UPI0013009908|nr:cytochrome C [Rhodoferax ferrireducens]